MSVFELFKAVKDFVVGKENAVNVVGLAMGAQRASAIVLLAASIFSSAKQFFGDPIYCLVDNFGSDQKGELNFFQTYCWFHGTSTTLLEPEEAEELDGLTPHPGIVQSDVHGQELEHMHHNYYQWICFVLAFQSLLCYVPYRLWKRLEGGKVARMLAIAKEDAADPVVSGCEIDSSVCSEASSVEASKSKPRRRLSQFISARIGTYNHYAFHYIGCLVLGVVNVIGQIYLMDLFLGGQFSHFGIELLSHAGDEVAIPARIRLFPRITKCTFDRYAVSGVVQNHEGLCILPLNIVNEKIYIFLWFWFVVLACVSVCHLLFQLILTISAAPRRLLLRARLPSTMHKRLGATVSSLAYGDWYVLMQLSRNLDSVQFRELLNQMEGGYQKDV